MRNLLNKIFKRKKLVLIIIALLVGGIFLYRRFFVSRNEVETVRIYKGEVKEELVLSGEVNADEYAKLAFQSNGELAFLGVAEGDEVKKGQVLAKLDTTNLYQAFQQADADLRRYQASLNKAYDDVQGHASNESFTQIETRTIAETNKDKAYRAYIAAEENLANATLRAPFDGVVTSITFPYTGINTVFSQPVMEVLSPKTIYFDVSADQSEVTEISKDQKVEIILDSFSDERYEGGVTFVAYTPKEGEVGAVYKIKVKFLGEDIDLDKFKLGLTGDAKFILSEKQDVLWVPPKFVKSDSEGKYVKLGRQNNKVYIQTGLEGEDRIEIVGDIKEGDVVYD